MAVQQQPQKKGIRARMMSGLLKVGFLRRFYLKRLLTLLKSGGTKKRPLPPQLQELRRAIMRVPKRQRYAPREAAPKQGPQREQNPPGRRSRRVPAGGWSALPGQARRRGRLLNETPPSRAVRRAAAKQQRRKR